MKLQQGQGTTLAIVLLCMVILSLMVDSRLKQVIPQQDQQYAVRRAQAIHFVDSLVMNQTDSQREQANLDCNNGPVETKKEEETSSSPVPEKVVEPSLAVPDTAAATFKTPTFFQNVSTKTIRKWGCDRTDTPFIFVHVGKLPLIRIQTHSIAMQANATSN